jgi:hypothetical protein
MNEREHEKRMKENANVNKFILTFYIFHIKFTVALLFCLATSQQQQQQQQRYHQQRHHGRKNQQQAKIRRVYAMCPPTFTKIGNECYHLSSTEASWLDSHFECKDKNAKLAEPLKYSDRLLRKYLMQRGRARGDIWIGGMFNWQKMRWMWGTVELY